MADNTTLNTGTGGDVIASDDIGPGVKYQRVKITLGADGVNDGDVSSSNALPVSDNGASLTVDGTVTANLAAGTNNIGDVDVLSVPAPLSTTGGGTEATALRVTLATDSTGVVSVDDNGGSLTVDAPVGTPAFVRLSDGAAPIATLPVSLATLPALVAGSANIGDVDVLTINGVAPAFGTGARGATVQRVTIATDDSVPVTGTFWQATQPVSGTVTANLAAGTNNIGDVDVLSVPAPLSTTGNGTAATALRVTLASDTTGLLDIEGDIAHDSPDSTSKPLKVGAKALAHGANPTAVAAADRTDLYANRHGVLWTIGGHPNIITRSVRIADADGVQTDASMVGTIAPGTKVAVTMLTVTCDHANTNATAVKVGFGATNIPADSATGANGVLLDHEGIAAGSGVNIGNGAAVIGIGADGEELRLTCEDPVGGFVIVTFSFFTIES